MPPEVVFFDAGGTMTFPPAEAVARVLGRTLDAEPFFEAFYRTIRALDDLPRPHPADVGHWWWARWLTEAGVDPDAAREAAPLLVNGGDLRWVHRREGVAETLQALRDAGIRLAVISNAGGMVAWELGEIGVAGYFEAIVDSHVVGVEKPDRRIFEIAMDRMRVAPPSAVHVGDVWSIDVLGARAAGITPVHLDPLGLYDHDEMRISKLQELPGLLGL